MEQTKALNALMPYLALTKSATAPRAAADLVTQATSNPNTYVFAELLETPQIQALAGSAEYAPYLRLLEIFSYGTFEGYRAAAAGGNQQGALPQLNDAQALKLRQLSLLTLARDPRNLSYAALQRALDLEGPRAVEDLVVGAVYAGLLEAQLDPRRQAVHVESVSPLRDLVPGDAVPTTLAALRTWSARCTDALAGLDAQVAAIRAAAARRHDEALDWRRTQARLIDEARPGLQAAQAAGGSRSLPFASADDGAGTGGGAHGRDQNRLIATAMARIRDGGSYMSQQRSVKRGSGSLEVGFDDDDEAMDVDEEEPDDGEGAAARGNALTGKQRASRRKL
ncbi:hypothetical protein GGR52DRAFT_573895 [Hypoxylon sp. FL1284]|nr:hypothetical protein GGR52DRAFT_573895 [Hypoxylon sp. FL1284]